MATEKVKLSAKDKTSLLQNVIRQLCYSFKRPCNHPVSEGDILINPKTHEVSVGVCKTCAFNAETMTEITDPITGNTVRKQMYLNTNRRTALNDLFPLVYQYRFNFSTNEILALSSKFNGSHAFGLADNFSVNQPSFNRVRYPMSYGFEVECVLRKDSINDVFNSEELTSGKIKLTELQARGGNKYVSNTKIRRDLIPNLWKLGSDTSIRYRDVYLNQGVEFKSNIMVGDLGIEAFEFLNSILTLKYNRSCGLHIHIGIPVEIYSDKSWLSKMDLLSPFMSMFLLGALVSKHRLQNRFCDQWLTNSSSYSTWHRNMLETVQTVHTLSAIRNPDTYIPYRGAITLNYDFRTVEFRILEGTNDVEKITKMVNLYMAIVNAALQLSEKEILDFFRLHNETFRKEVGTRNDCWWLIRSIMEGSKDEAIGRNVEFISNWLFNIPFSDRLSYSYLDEKKNNEIPIKLVSANNNDSCEYVENIYEE